MSVLYQEHRLIEKMKLRFWPKMTYRTRESLAGWLMASPWIIGFLVFMLGPIVASLALSFTDWNLLSKPNFIGVQNYKQMMKDPMVWHSLSVTAVYSIVSVPLHLVIGFLLALLLNRKIKGMTFWRSAYYLPTMISGVAASMLWKWVFDPDFGILNALLHTLFHVGKINWLGNPYLVLPSLIFMSLWTVGGSMLINLAGLQKIPSELYEAAQIDRAGPVRQLFYITIPMMTPIMFLNLIMGIIGSFQTFTSAYVMTGGGPNNASTFYMLYLYLNAFQYFHMGYASALAWVLFVLVMLLSLIVFVSGKYWVFYEGANSR